MLFVPVNNATYPQLKLSPAMKFYSQGRNEGGKGGRNFPGAESLSGRQITAGAPKSPNNVTSTFLNTVHLLPKVLRFEHGGLNLLLDQGAI